MRITRHARSIVALGVLLSAASCKSQLLDLPDAATGPAAPWPMFGHDAQRTSRTGIAGPQTAAKKRSILIAGSSPTVPSPTIGGDGTLYVGSNTGVLYAFAP